LSRRNWLTDNGRFTHISGHPSAAGRAQRREVRRPETDILPLCHATNKPGQEKYPKCFSDQRTYNSMLLRVRRTFLLFTLVWLPVVVLLERDEYAIMTIVV